ncbi:MAG: ATPase [Gammaproteobacteria bacterium]|nr:ATPase [Gammaproteobacteria bacterium]
MAHRAIREFDGKRMISDLFQQQNRGGALQANRCVQVTESTDYDQLTKDNPWLSSEKLVVKPDQLIKRRGNNNLLLLNADWSAVTSWISDKLNQDINVDDVQGTLTTFIVEPFVKHDNTDEYYFAIHSQREHDEILFYHQGGVDVGDIDAKALRLRVPTLEKLDKNAIFSDLLPEIDETRQSSIAEFISTIFDIYRQAGFVYLEVNPIVYVDDKINLLDLAAKLDDTAEHECGQLWGDFQFPPPFGRRSTTAERYISELDAQSGASLKFTVLNPNGRIWTMVAGGGASVVYTDTIADLGYGTELANYGEYSGDPTADETYEYARTIIELMTEHPDPQGREKVLIIGGGIANFTDVGRTFGVIALAIKQYRDRLANVNAKIYVRRGGPNYKEALAEMRALGDEINLPIEVYGPETHMTRVVNLALAA